MPSDEIASGVDLCVERQKRLSITSDALFAPYGLHVAARPALQQHKDALIPECYMAQDRCDGAAIAKRSC
jgi:hypothetical protein